MQMRLLLQVRGANNAFGKLGISRAIKIPKNDKTLKEYFNFKRGEKADKRWF